MATQVQVRRSGTYEDIDYSDFTVEVVTSAIGAAPSASVTTQARESITANQDIRIVVDNTTIFEGVTDSPGRVRTNGQVSLQASHDADALFEDRVDITLTGTVTVTDVLDAALSNANRGGDFTLDYAGTDTTLDSDYDVENRKVTQVFRDMTDRTSRVWWVDPAGSTIHVEPIGDRGTWQTLDAQTDGVTTRSYDDGSVKTVRNDVTVTATGGEAVSATATDSTSISTYGRRSEEVNIQYAATQAEAQAYADELLIPDPLAQAELGVPESVGNVTQTLVNYTVDYTDDPKDISATGLVVEKQTIKQGRVVLATGEGTGVSIENVNRSTKSDGDKTPPGTVINTDRLADDSVDSNQLVDASVIEAKLQDAAVATAKLQNNAVINGKLADLSVSETKIQDDSISTPKLVAEAVTAAKIEADTITAAEIAAGTITALEIAADTITASEIAADTITALEIAADTLTANEIDTLDLETQELTIGTDASADRFIEFILTEDDLLNDRTTMRPGATGTCLIGTESDPFAAVNAQEATFVGVEPRQDNSGSVGSNSRSYTEMWAYDYIDAATGSSINDGGDVLADLHRGQRPPQHCRACDDDGEELGISINSLAKHLWDICTAQQDRIDDLEERLSALEEQV